MQSIPAVMNARYQVHKSERIPGYVDVTDIIHDKPLMGRVLPKIKGVEEALFTWTHQVHPCFAEIYRYLVFDNHYLALMEPLGEVAPLLELKPTRMKPETVVTLFLNLVSAFHFLSSRGLYHPHLDLSKMFYGGERRPLIIVGHEVCLAKDALQAEDPLANLDVRYAAPELMARKTRTAETEVYHLGALFIHFLTGRILPPGETFSGVTQILRKLKKSWDPILASMLEPEPSLRPAWSELWEAVQVLREPGGALIPAGPVWLASEDNQTLELLKDSLVRAKTKPQALALQVFPGREKVQRLEPFTKLAEHQGFMVFHSWVVERETRHYKIINDIILLLREGVVRYLDHPEFESELLPLSEWHAAEDLVAKWRDLMARVFEAIVPRFCKGFVLIIEDIQHMDRASFETLMNFSSWVAHLPFVLVLTGDAFAHPHFRELDQHWPFDWHYLHPARMNETRLNELVWHDQEPQFEPELGRRLLRETNREEVWVFYWLEDHFHHPGLFERYLENQWCFLASKEQLVLKVLASSRRRLSLRDLETAFRVTGLEAALEKLRAFRFLGSADDHHFTLVIPALAAFVQRQITRQDRAHIQIRLFEHESSLPEPDPVQSAYLAAILRRKEALDPFLQCLEAAVFDRFDLEPLWRLECIYRKEHIVWFRDFARFAELLRGMVPDPQEAARKGPLMILTRANRQLGNGHVEKALAAYRQLASRPGVRPGFKAHALVRSVECAALVGDSLTLLRNSRRFETLPAHQFEPGAYYEWCVRLAVARAAVEAPLQAWPSYLRDWNIANQTWRTGDFKESAARAEAALGRLREHYDLNWRGLAFKLHGNTLFRENRPGKAIDAYRRAERYFSRTCNALELASIRFNLATAENLAGRFISSKNHFEPLYRQAMASGDRATQCQILYNFMVCSLFLNDLDSFDRYAHEHDKLAQKLGDEDEQLKGTVLKLNAALLYSKDEVSEDLTLLRSLLQRRDPYPLLRDEALVAMRLAHFVLGLPGQDRPPPYSELTQWRHQLLDHLTGKGDATFEELVSRVGPGYFGACHFLWLRQVIEADLIPVSGLSQSLASAFEEHMIASGAHYEAFHKKAFAHLRNLGEVPREHWEGALHHFESLDWPNPDTTAFQKKLLQGLQSTWPFCGWGACERRRGGWVPLAVVDGRDEEVPAEIDEHLQESHLRGLEGPLVTTFVHPHTHEPRSLLLLPIDPGLGREVMVWFVNARAAAHDLGAHYEPLFRFYAKLFEFVFYRASLERPPEPAVLPSATDQRGSRFGIIGQSGRMTEVLAKVYKFAPSDLNIYIWGESGTGKELVARAIHQSSNRVHKPFRTINCTNFPDNLVESELFGHVRGSFTGATMDKAGLLELVNGGTLFLDEIGDINEKIQSLLLRVIQEGEFARIGDSRVRKVDIRFVTATNKNIHHLIDEGVFRDDLFFRMVEVEIQLPALRERFEDLPRLAIHFAKKHEPSRNITFQRSFFERLRGYDWPGNVRELESYIRRVLVSWSDKRVITEREILTFLRPGSQRSEVLRTLDAFETANRIRFLRERLSRFGGNRTQTARSLDISRQQLVNLLSKYRIA